MHTAYAMHQAIVLAYFALNLLICTCALHVHHGVQIWTWSKLPGINAIPAAYLILDFKLRLLCS